MKYLLSLIILLYCVEVRAQIVTATVTVTNTAGTTNGQTITVNGTTRTWTNNFTLVSSQIPTNSTISGAASNLFVSYITVRPSSLTVSTNSTNAVAFKSFPGSALVITVSAGWATVGYNTNGTTPDTFLRVPLANAGNIERTNVESGLTDYLNDSKATNVISASAPTLSNFVSLSAVQTITGDKTFNGANTYSNSAQIFSGGTITNAMLSNCVPALTNGYASDLVLTNGQNYGAPFRSPGSALQSEQFGTSATATGVGALAIGNSANASAQGTVAVGVSAAASSANAIALGQSAAASGGAGIAIGASSIAAGSLSVAIGNSTEADAPQSTAVGYAAVSTHTNSTAIGTSATTTTTNQVRLGTSSEYVSIPGGLSVEGGTTNIHAIGTNTWDGDISFLRKNITSLANGANSISASTNLYLKVSGPTGAFSINGISGGRDGRMLIIQNSTAQTCTITHDSGLELTAANRIYTGTAADVSSTNNPGCFTLIYDSALSRWILVNKN